MTEDKTVKGILYGVPVTATIKGKPEYIPRTEEVSGAYNFWLQQCSDETVEEITEKFDRWLAEVKAERDKHIISLIKKDCEHAKFGDPCFHDYIIDEIEAQLNRQGEEQ